MPAAPPQPRRTVAIIVLDRITAAAGSVRRVATGRADGPTVARLALLAALAVLVATAVAVVVVLRTPERLAPVALDPPPAVAVPTGSPAGGVGVQAEPPSSRPTSGRPSPAASSAAPPTSASPAAPPATGAALGAEFAIEERALLSYGAAVTIRNPGPGRVTDWTLAVTLPRESLEVTSVSGARVTRDGATWTFVPDGAGGAVPGGGSVRVGFRVTGSPVSARPTACTIDGTPCAGLD
ncbi:cellulose binding domain-containing protein [Micromonospora sp. C28SCA-DRY-2]|uniref:cellulose binding domain-containing protein n=1 Tax=Micromonospora sp. C28SCA-DRY-2 TaxID=3059522 RepID=UPI002676D418|nr:cellulose binding domain-containing protein [Micromonospora sp. C28SCA-DRY-2]MDO3703019.1 cellulose binding domain-containing protein [Micromonospora sp. C28SCA-DRY-2]